MSRRTPVLATVAALAALSGTLTAAASAATQQHRTADRHTGPVSVRVDARSTTPAGSVALFGSAGGDFQAARNVSGTRPKKTSHFNTNGGDALASSVNPVGGNDGLVCTSGQRIFPVRHLRTTPRLGTTIRAARFSGEGGSDYSFYCYGAAVHGSSALVAGDSEGLLQLRRVDGTWKVDTRVKFPGNNDAGHPHQRGWIDFRNSLVHSAATFDSVAVAPKAHHGKLLGVTLDRGGDTLVVVQGVGTATPRPVGALDTAALGGSNSQPGYGVGGVAFLPGSSTQAIIAITNGFAVLDLTHPAAPRLAVKTTVDNATGTIGSLSVSNDGTTLAVAAGPRVYSYKNVQGAVRHHSPFKLQTSFRLGDSATETVSDVAYTSHDTLVVLHGDAAVSDSWRLTLVKRVPEGGHAVKGSTATKMPPDFGSLTVWPTH